MFRRGPVKRPSTGAAVIHSGPGGGLDMGCQPVAWSAGLSPRGGRGCATSGSWQTRRGLAAVNPGTPLRVWLPVTGTLALYDSAGPAIGTVTRDALDADDALTALYAAHYRKLVRIAALLLDDYSLS